MIRALKISLTSFILLLIAWGCSHIESIGMRTHEFGQRARRVVWLQIPGLMEEHLALLRFEVGSPEQTGFEKSTCMGKLWSYNATQLKPHPELGFRSQILGDRSVTGTCEDFDKMAPWNAGLFKTRTLVLEKGVEDKESLSQTLSCQEAEAFNESATYFRMKTALANQEEFHFQESQTFEKKKEYFDKSCKGTNCYSGLFGNAQALWFGMKNQSLVQYLVIRDFSYLKALKNNDLQLARDILKEISKTYEFFQSQLDGNPDTLLLLTSTHGENINFPDMGPAWEKILQGKKIALGRDSTLSAPVFADGAGAENFCGLYPEFEIYQRILWTPTRSGLKIF